MKISCLVLAVIAESTDIEFITAKIVVPMFMDALL